MMKEIALILSLAILVAGYFAEARSPVLAGYISSLPVRAGCMLVMLASHGEKERLVSGIDAMISGGLALNAALLVTLFWASK